MSTLSILKTMNDKAIQNWLKQVGRGHVQTLVIALLGADEDVKKSIYRNMSPSAATQLRKEIEMQRTKENRQLDIDTAAGMLANFMR